MVPLSREQIRERLRSFLVDTIEKAGGPKAVALQLQKLGYKGRNGKYEEGTIRSWRGSSAPAPEVVFALSAQYKVSIDHYVFGQALEARLREEVGGTLAHYGDRLDKLEQSLRYLSSYLGIEIEDEQEVPTAPLAATWHEMVIELRELRQRVTELGRGGA